MKTLLTVSICSLALVMGALAQSPTAATAANAAPPAASVSPGAVASPSASIASDLADRIHQRIEKKLKQKGVHFQIGDDESSTDSGSSHSDSHSNDIPTEVIPLVAIVFMTLFGAPVLIVAVIMYFGFSRNRMMHKTVRMMVEKGQPVPAALLNPPPHVRKRSDMRRGVVLMMIGAGLMLFFGAVNAWEGGAWSLGIIPFLVGVGYLLVWKLEGSGDPQLKGDNPPPVP